MEDSNFDFSKGYGDNKIVLQVRDAETIRAYWEIGRKELERIEREFKDKGLVLRLFNLTNRTSEIKYIDVGKNFLGSYYLKREHGINPNNKYTSDMGVLSHGEYILLVPDSNIVETPRNSISDDTSEEWLDTSEKKETQSESKLDEKGTLKLLEKTDKQIKEDRKSSETRQGYFIK